MFLWLHIEEMPVVPLGAHTQIKQIILVWVDGLKGSGVWLES